MLEQQIEQDLKTALLSGDRLVVDTLKGVKSALLYLKVEKGKRDSGLSKEEEIAVLLKESKKRAESAELYLKGGSEDRAKKELAEKDIIDKFLPKQLSQEEVETIVSKTIAELNASDISSMGKVIVAVKEKTAGSADGSLIARLVKERLS